MKSIIYLLLLCSLFSCKPEIKDHYIINGTAKGIYNGMRAYLKEPNERGQLINKDTAIVLDEKFSFKGVRNEPTLEYLYIDGHKNYLPLIIENGAIDIAINKDSIETSNVSGTTNNKEYALYSKEQRQLNTRIKTLTNQFKKATIQNATNKSELYKNIIENRKKLSNLNLDFIKNHENSYVSAIILNSIITDKQTSITDLENLFSGLTEAIKNSEYGKYINASILKQKQLRQQQKGIQIGDMAPNFTANTPEGKPLALYDIKGKVTIIDFWASWCGPCRRENPYVVKTYNKFHEKGLEIISVSLDKNGQKDRWIKALQDDNMSWHHVSNLQSWQDPIARSYGVRSIPATFILDASGKVIAKNLRGSALENKIAELIY
ncbi:TlpA disulfide reductase family protein [Postechiella marina]|uniref:TlpA disulfide reductase family protein n=1 Tax=Postechiella marina TaxID=943941 RepID=A0ABP8CBR3_9FLAO